MINYYGDYVWLRERASEMERRRQLLEALFYFERQEVETVRKAIRSIRELPEAPAAF